MHTITVDNPLQQAVTLAVTVDKGENLSFPASLAMPANGSAALKVTFRPLLIGTIQALLCISSKELGLEQHVLQVILDLDIPSSLYADPCTFIPAGLCHIFKKTRLFEESIVSGVDLRDESCAVIYNQPDGTSKQHHVFITMCLYASPQAARWQPLNVLLAQSL